jgi:uncharacterized protein YndB with AHSA1/START domain
MSKTEFIAEPGKQEIVMVRTFVAPRAKVYSAYVDPKAIPQWWGPRILTTVVDRLEPRHGGLWRYVQRDPQGNEFAFRGVFHEARAPERLVRTFEFEMMPEHVLLETVDFEEAGKGTKVTARSVFQTLAARDGMVQSGAEGGAVEAWERLEDLLSAS